MRKGALYTVFISFEAKNHYFVITFSVNILYEKCSFIPRSGRAISFKPRGLLFSYSQGQFVVCVHPCTFYFILFIAHVKILLYNDLFKLNVFI